jgi:3-deoxy-D-manno-octulosonic-acid transferase
MFWLLIYNIFLLPIVWLFFKIYSLLNEKVREGFKGRNEIFNELNSSLNKLDKNKKTVLIHSSSLGEYQQALPFVDELLQKNYNIVLSFFSPSGYKNAKVPQGNVTKCYLPFDTKSKIKKFLSVIEPSKIIFIRYDLWLNILNEGKKRNSELYLVNARYDEKDFTWNFPVISSFKKYLYGMLDKIFVIDEYDEKNYREKLKNYNTEIIKVGDSKFERVYESSKKIQAKKIIDEKIIEDKKIFVIGSSWKDDEDVILPALNKIVLYEENLLTFLVPHEPKETKIKAIENFIEDNYPNLKTIRYSHLHNFSYQNIIIVDTIGILYSLYSIAYISYVGGGLKTGLHNILEPAIFNMPVFFSNKVKNSDEDEIMISAGPGILVNDSKDFYKNFRSLLSNKHLRDSIGEKSKLVFENNLGIAKKVIEKIS